jgi:hypothetical protein
VRLVVSFGGGDRVCSLFRIGRLYPREPDTKVRLPVRHEFHCEALVGVADPETTWPGEMVASTQEGG